MPVDIATLKTVRDEILKLSPSSRADLKFETTVNRGESRQARIVQELLCVNGLNVALDGDFGDATADAVISLQKREGLPQRDAVDEDTHLALLAPLLEAAAPRTTKTRFGEAVIEIANRHVQHRPVEIGGDNCGPWVRLYCRGQDGSAFRWCAGFVSFVLHQAAAALKLPAPPLKYTLSCDNLAHDAQTKNVFVPGAGTRPAIAAPAVFLVRHTVDDWVHTGLAMSFGNGSFSTIEGNTNQGGSANGFEACTRQRGYANIDFIRLP